MNAQVQPSVDGARRQLPWRRGVAAVTGLLFAIAIVGVVGIIINRGVEQVVDRAIQFDIELEDNADDLRVAVLEVRHYHRDMLFPSPLLANVDTWEDRYEELLAQIDELAALVDSGLDRSGLPSVSGLREAAETYYEEFRPAVYSYDPNDDLEFVNASDEGLARLNAIETVAAAIDQAGETRAAASFEAIDDAVHTGTLALIAVIIGLGVIGAALGFAVVRMIEDSRRLVLAEQAVVAQLAEASRTKTDFIADASHELRTPLTVLRGNAEVGLAMEDDCAHAEVLREIVTEATRMSRLVDDLLFLARSDVASVPLELQHADVRELLAAIAGRAEILTHERGSTLEATLDVGGSIVIDARRVDQAVMILIDNAAKYGRPGGMTRLDAEERDGALWIRVTDEGAGIPEDELSHVFERFYRIDPARARRAGGAGLGLPIARAIVEGHGGKLSAESRLGHGTTMTIRLPLAAPAEDGVTQASAETAPGVVDAVDAR